MVSRSAAIILTLLFAAASAFAQPAETPKLRDAGQDGSGRIWAIPEERSSRLLVNDGSGWRAVEFPNENLGDARFLKRRADGKILGFWSGGGPFTIAEHSAEGARILARLDHSIDAYEAVNVFIDSRENIWLIEHQGDITRITPEGGSDLHYRIPDEMLMNAPANPDYTNTNYCPVLAIEDGAGRIWFWSYLANYNFGHAALRGLLVFDGEKFTHHAKIPGLKDNVRFSAVVKKDARHLFLSVNMVPGPLDYKWGLMDFDTETFAVTPLPEPERDAFARIEKIIQTGDDLYVISSGWAEGHALWRRRGEGAWRKVIPALDGRAFIQRPWERPFVSIASGWIIGCAAGSPWFVAGDSGKASRLDWRAGVGMVGLKRLFILPDKRVFALQQDGRSFLGRLDLPPKPAASERVRVLTPPQELVFGPGGHVWGILDAGTPELSEWDGARWIAHPFPAGFKAAAGSGFAADSAGRLWLLSSSREGDRTVACYDPADAKWQVFPSFAEALSSEPDAGRRKVVFPHQHPGFNEPVFDEQGRIAFLTRDWKLAYFDGRRWRYWGRGQIKGDDRPFLSPPRFEADGSLRVNAENETWYFDEKSGWRRGRFVPDDSSEPRQQTGAVVLPPEYANGRYDSAARDNEGTIWFTRDGQLYKCRGSRVATVFAPDERHPFLDGRQAKAAFVDENGNVFIKTIAAGPDEYVIVSPRLPLPRTKITLENVTADCVTLSFSNEAAGKASFQWRLDGGGWRESDGGAAVDALSNGGHTVEAFATNEELRVEKSPASIRFTISVDLDALIAGWIRQLMDGTPDAREKAVAELVKRPGAALPALRAVDGSAISEPQRWWLEATIQEIGRREKSKQKTP